MEAVPLWDTYADAEVCCLVWRLSAADQARISKLFSERKPVNANLRYRLTRTGPNGVETVEAARRGPPASLTDRSVQTTID